MKANKPGLILLSRWYASGGQLRCILFESYKRNLPAGKVLEVLLAALEEPHFRPYFKPGQINKLFENEVLKPYANGRYLYQDKLDSLPNWFDILNNKAAIAVVNYEYVRNNPDAHPQDIAEARSDMRLGIRTLKIIEDWLYHHPEEQTRLSLLLFERSATIAE